MSEPDYLNLEIPKNNSEAIDSLEESLEEKVDQGDIDEICDRLDKIEEQIQTLKEDIAYLKGYDLNKMRDENRQLEEGMIDNGGN